MSDQWAAESIQQWLKQTGPIVRGDTPQSLVLNVAGSRESKAPGIQQRVTAIVVMVLQPPFYVPGLLQTE